MKYLRGKPGRFFPESFVLARSRFRSRSRNLGSAIANAQRNQHSRSACLQLPEDVCPSILHYFTATKPSVLLGNLRSQTEPDPLLANLRSQTGPSLLPGNLRSQTKPILPLGNLSSQADPIRLVANPRRFLCWETRAVKPSQTLCWETPQIQASVARSCILAPSDLWVLRYLWAV